ncbi:MAG: c-type cytochrome [Burkholderiaceae bacterium]
MMKWLSIALTASIGLVAAAPAFAQEALAKSSGCLTCHAPDVRKMGPSFKDIAAKYKGKSDAEATLSAKLSNAKGHPAVKGSPDDVNSLVKWILSL